MGLTRGYVPRLGPLAPLPGVERGTVRAAPGAPPNVCSVWHECWAHLLARRLWDQPALLQPTRSSVTTLALQARAANSMRRVVRGPCSILIAAGAETMSLGSNPSVISYTSLIVSTLRKLNSVQHLGPALGLIS